MDTSAETETFDARSCDELDSDDEKMTTKSDKRRTVFSQLQNDGLIAGTESYETCVNFYGISAQNVREDRKKKRTSNATKDFSRFEDGLLAVLDETVKFQTRQAVGKLILLQMSIVHAMGRIRQSLPRTLLGSSLDFDMAKSVGKSLHETLTNTIASQKKIGMLINCNFLNFEERFKSVADQYQVHSARPATGLEARTYYMLLVKESESADQPSFTPRKEDTPFLRFLVVMKGVILDRTFNVLKSCIGEFLKTTTEQVEVHSMHIANPLLGYAFRIAYGSLGSTCNEESSLPQASADVLKLLKTMVCHALRKILTKLLIEGLLHAIEWTSSNASFDLGDKQTRRKITDLILSKFNHEVITESLCVASRKGLNVVHDAFFKVIDDLSRVNDLVSTSTSQQLQEMSILFVPRIRHLFVQSLALEFLLTKEPLILGPVLKSTKHGKIHDCSGWVEEGYIGACVVKVIEEENVDPEVWAQTSVDLFNVM